MAYYIFQIPSRTCPKELIKIKEDIYCFASNQTYPIINTKKTSRFLCLVINTNYGSNVIKILKDFIIVLNIFSYEWHSIKWFSDFALESEPTSNETIQDIYAKYRIDINLQGHFYNFNEMYPILIYVKSFKFSFIEVFNKLYSLQKTDFLYNSLSYLAVNNAIILISNKIYSNGLFDGALSFQLFESIMNEFDKTPEIKKDQCPKCNHVKKRGLNKRVEDFFTSDLFKNQESKKEIISVIKKAALNRHKFFHNLKGKTKVEYFMDLMSNFDEGQIVNVNDDIKYAEGAIQAIGVLKAVNTLILLNKLLNREIPNIEILEGVVEKESIILTAVPDTQLQEEKKMKN